MMQWLGAWQKRGSRQQWGACLLALLLPLLMLQLRIQLPIAFGERPLLVLFMLPIIVCALLGGLLLGLLSTLVTALITPTTCCRRCISSPSAWDRIWFNGGS